jgi:ribosomal protein S18 acetylase RimI-like enzyme
MTMDYTLRLATTKDADDLMTAEFELFPENNFNEKTLQTEILHGLTWVVHLEDLLIGYAICSMWESSLIDILRLGVLPHFRRRGIASRLLDEVKRHSKHLMLTVRKGNDDAINLYKKHGFQITGTLPQHYSWLMQRKTTSS